jgi:hypothetical protein
MLCKALIGSGKHRDDISAPVHHSGVLHRGGKVITGKEVLNLSS